jgi:hypothetical protein
VTFTTAFSEQLVCCRAAALRPPDRDLDPPASLRRPMDRSSGPNCPPSQPGRTRRLGFLPPVGMSVDRRDTDTSARRRELEAPAQTVAARTADVWMAAGSAFRWGNPAGRSAHFGRSTPGLPARVAGLLSVW